MKITKNQKGLASAIALLVLGILTVLISAGAYYLLKGTGQYFPDSPGTKSLDFSGENGYAAPSNEKVPISYSDKTIDIQTELNSTNIGEVESDMNALESGRNSF